MSGEFLIEGLNAYILVFCRIGGLIFFNPLLARKNVPNQFRMALVLGLVLIITPGVSDQATENMQSLTLIFAMMKELFVGFACGLVFQFFYYLLFAAGDIVDIGFGLSMAKAFDPGTNIQMSLSGNLFQLLFIMYFFATDSHLTFIRLMYSSYDIVSVGAVTIGAQVGTFLITMFLSAFSLIMKLAVPFIVASFVLEVAMGVLMKLNPQINVFSIHFQLKIILGFGLLFLFAVPVGNFMENYVNIMNKSLMDFFQVI